MIDDYKNFENINDFWAATAGITPEEYSRDRKLRQEITKEAHQYKDKPSSECLIIK